MKSKKLTGIRDMRLVPSLRVIDPANARFSLEVRIFGWGRVREIAKDARVGLTERRIGLITKEFEVRGDEAGLNRFVRIIYSDDSMLGESFRNEFTKETSSG